MKVLTESLVLPYLFNMKEDVLETLVHTRVHTQPLVDCTTLLYARCPRSVALASAVP